MQPSSDEKPLGELYLTPGASAAQNADISIVIMSALRNKGSVTSILFSQTFLLRDMDFPKLHIEE